MNDYPILPLGDIVKPVQDRMADRTKWHFDKYIAGEHIESGQVRIKNYGQIKGNEEVIGSAFHMCFKPGHVLYSTRRAYLRKAGIVNFEGICSNVTLVLQSKEEKLLQSLLPFILQSEGFVQFAIGHSIGSTNPFVKWTDLSKYPVRVPPIATQQKISKILWAIEDNIEKIENFIEVSEEFKNALLKKLFTKGTGHGEFKSTELGEIPKEWNLNKLSQISLEKVTNGVFNDPKRVGHGYKLINVKDMYSAESIDAKNLTLLDIDKDTFEKRKVQTGDLFFTRSSLVKEGIGYCNIYVGNDSDITFDGHVMRVRPNSSIVLPKFLLYYCKSQIARDMLISKSKTTAITTLGQKDLVDLVVPCPPLKEQERIVKLMDSTDADLKLEKIHLRQILLLRKKLTDAFLSGQLLFSEEDIQ